MGLFDRDDILLRFVVDEPTLRTILETRGFVRDDAATQAYTAGKYNWEGFCQEALQRPEGRYGLWIPRTPMKTPVVYTRDASAKGESVTALLWDTTTGEVYVHRVGG